MTQANGRPLFRMLGPDREFLGEQVLPEENEISIGRSEANDIVVRDPTVSRHHAKITRTPEGQLIWHDTASSNGTWLGEEKVERHTLEHGNRLRIGSTTMVFLCKRRTISDFFSSGMWRVVGTSVDESSDAFRIEACSTVASGDTPEISARLIRQRRRRSRRGMLTTVGLGIVLVLLIIISLLLMR